jgi:xylene monooxygenase electron transfer component
MPLDTRNAPATRGDLCAVRVCGPGAAESFSVRRNDLLLKAALEQGIDYPHNCRVGVCGRCKTRILQGRVSPMVDLALSPLKNEEIEQGYVLACQAKVRTDLQIAVRLGAATALPVRSVSGRVCHWRRLPGEVIDLRLALDEPLPFLAGQYATLAESGSFVRRSYSFYDAPPDPEGPGTTEVGFLVKRLPGGRFSEWLFAEDRTGTKFWLEAPLGVMAVPPAEAEVLCVAGGTGIAPILSIIADGLRRWPAARFTLVFGVRSAQDRFADGFLDALRHRAPDRLRVLPILSHEPAGSAWAGARGLVTELLTPELGLDFSRATAFVCGSVAMVEAVERRLVALGVDAERIHADKFLPTG